MSHKTILIVNQKGGVGKSLIADELAFSLERTNTPYSFVDLDQQGSVCHNTNIIDNAQITIVDTPGALQVDMENWIKNADVVVIPSRCTSKDIEPLKTMRDMINAQNAAAKTIYVLNGYSKHKKFKDFYNGFKSTIKPKSTTFIAQCSAYDIAHSKYKSILNIYTKNKSAQALNLEMINEIRKLAELEPEQKEVK